MRLPSHLLASLSLVACEPAQEVECKATAIVEAKKPVEVVRTQPAVAPRYAPQPPPVITKKPAPRKVSTGACGGASDLAVLCGKG